MLPAALTPLERRHHDHDRHAASALRVDRLAFVNRCNLDNLKPDMGDEMTWKFIVDGCEGHAERYGSKPLDVFIFWHNLGCHLSGTIPKFRQAVLDAEPRA